MTAGDARPRHGARPSRGFAYGSFAIMAGGWIAFFAALIVSQQTLEDVWTAVRDLPLVVEGVVWLLAFPFLVGLAIWHASWDQPVRVVAVAVLAVSYTYMFMPRERRKR